VPLPSKPSLVAPGEHHRLPPAGIGSDAAVRLPAVAGAGPLGGGGGGSVLVVVGSAVAAALGDGTADVAEDQWRGSSASGCAGNDGEQAARTRLLKAAREDPSNWARS
jgi:hypothetical protein